jgi:hypothetical protein
MTAEWIRIKVEKCSPKEPISRERNYCRDCGYPIVWTEEWGWIAGSRPDPEFGVFAAPPNDGDGE